MVSLVSLGVFTQLGVAVRSERVCRFFDERWYFITTANAQATATLITLLWLAVVGWI